MAPHDAWSAWSAEPGVLLGLAVAGVLFGRGWRRRRGTRRWQAAAFWIGWTLLAVALVSPLHRMGAALLWAHMAQHELLMVAAAPLLVLGRPLVVSLRGLPPLAQRWAGGWLARLRPLARTVARLEVAWTLHALAILAWHAPSLYGRTVESELIHSLQHASFLGTALLYWWSVLTEARLYARQGGAILSLFGTMIYTGGLGALLTVAPRPWYPEYGAAAPPWGLTPLEDQQLAGLIMWVPASLSYLLATLWLVAAWLRESEARAGVLTLPVLLFLVSCESRATLSNADATQLTGGDPVQGRAAFRKYGCGACHSLRDIPGASGKVGPPLDGLGARAYIAGMLNNTPDNLVRWIEAPREVDPRTAMPDVGVTPTDARNLAAFLYTRP